MRPIKISSTRNSLEGSVQLPFSKSESNRALIINALSDFNCSIQNLSDAEDTLLLQKLISSEEKIINCENAGTVLRFLTAYFALCGKEKIITGSDRMKQRPIGSLVNALRTLGADISYLENENFPPIKINSSLLNKADKVEIDGSESSQFISALLLIAPCLPHGLTIRLTNSLVSKPYIEMTVKMMEQAGIEVLMDNQSISIRKQDYQPTEFKINADWSAAAFFYEMVALSKTSTIYLPQLHTNSLQGDEVIAKIMKQFGVGTHQERNGINIRKTKNSQPEYFTYNFSDYPDISLPVAATCGALSVKADLHGLKNLVIKESNRAYAFQREAYKLNIKTDFCDFSKLKILEESKIKSTSKIISTYNDHRIAMTFAPLALATDAIFIDDADVVKKSFPDFWSEITNVGFKIEG